MSRLLAAATKEFGAWVNALLVSSLGTFHLKMKVWKITIFSYIAAKTKLIGCFE